MTSSICEWCAKPLEGNQIVSCSPSHRLKRWRWLHGIPVSPSVGVERPPEGSPLLDGFGASGGVQTASEGSRVSNGGLQVSVGRMLQVLQEGPWVLPEVQARRAIARALPEKQRARFDHTPDPALPGQLDLEGREAA